MTPHDLNRAVLEEITAKWSLAILGALCAGPVRFNGLLRANPGITQKALTQALRRLEASGFVTRQVLSLAPVAVAYEISPLGRTLEPHLKALLHWAETHGPAVKLAQQAFAAQAEALPTGFRRT